MDIWRIEHQENGFGPFNGPNKLCRCDYLESDDDNLVYTFDILTEPEEINNFWKFGRRSHSAAHVLDTLREGIAFGWFVGCTSIEDLRHWFGQDSLLLSLEERGYVLRRYCVDPAYFENDYGTKQCVFDKNHSMLLDTLSVLDVAS